MLNTQSNLPPIFPLRFKLPSLRQLLHCYRVFNNFEKQLLTVALSLLVASTVWFTALQVGATLVSVPIKGGTYTEALIGQPQFVNPIYAPLSSVDTDLSALVFTPLMRYDEQLNLQPALLSNLAADTTGTLYTATLAPNYVWHDGEPVTTADIAFTFEKIIDPQVRSPLAETFKTVKVTAVDAQTVTFKLAAPYPDFPHTLNTGVIPKHIWEKIPVENWRTSDINTQPIGNGLWQFASSKTNNDGYITTYTLRHTTQNNITPNIDKLVFAFFTDELAATSALQARAVQGLFVGAGVSTKASDQQSGMTYHELASTSATGIFFNLGKTGILADKRVRQALSLAIDRRQLVVDTLEGSATPLFSAIPDPKKTHSNINNIFDTAEAEKILTAAGWQRIGAIRQNTNDETLTINLSVVNREPDLKIASFIQNSWANIGVDTKIVVIDPATSYNLQQNVLKNRDYDALIYTLVYGPKPDPYPYWHSSQRVYPGFNLSGVGSQELDDAIVNYRKNVNQDESELALYKVLTLINKEYSAIFLYSPTHSYIQSSLISGMANNRMAIPAHRFNNIQNWFADKKYQIQRD